MSVRTTPDLVKGVLTSRNYDVAAGTDLAPFIDSASALVDLVYQCSVRKGDPYPASVLEVMERWLSAYYYTISDPIYKRKRTERAEGEFFDRNFLQPALGLDPLGCLGGLLERKVATGFWLGTPRNEQRTYDERN